MEKNSNDTQNEIILSRILKLMGFDGIDMDDFDNRLKYQKLVYLAQNTGINIGYGYSWYVRGPYSPLLTRTLFNIKENPALFDKWDTIKFKHEDVILKRLRRLQDVLGSHFNDPKYLEVIASLHYLRTTLPTSENSYSQIKKRLLMLKPDLKNIPHINHMMDNACKDLINLN
ncbi:MAG: hypothetical protein LUQ66_05640 [Methanoregula sp.]|nr:hypothetical protein [Methanoregula sp.]